MSKSSSSIDTRNLLLKITGIHPNIFSRSSPSFRTQLLTIGAGMLFTACISGCLLALSIHYFFGDAIAALLAFALSFIFTLLLDRKLIAATVPLGGGGHLVRFMLVAAWIIIHTTMLETIFFTEDLQAFLHQQQQPTVTAVQEKYEHDIKQIQDQRKSIQADIRQHEQLIADAHKAAELEANGKGVTGEHGVGEMTLYLEGLANQRVIQAESQIERRSGELAVLDQRLENAKRTRKEELAALPTIVTYGPLKRAELLHQMLWGPGNWSMKAIAIAILLLITAVELLPLIGKGLADFTEYHQLHRTDKEHAFARATMNARIQREIEAVEMAHQSQLEKVRVRTSYRRQEQELRMREVVARYKQKVACLQSLDDEIEHANRHTDSRAEETLAAATQQAIKDLQALAPEY